MVSATSNGFFNIGGKTMPVESFTKHAPTSNSAGTQNNGLPYQGSFAFCSGVLACHHFHAPTALMPINGEMATPVIKDSVWAISWPGLFLLSGAAVVVAASVRAVISEKAKQ